MGFFTMLQTMYKLGIPSRNKRVPRSTIAAEDVLSLVSPTPWKCAATLYKFSVTENILQKYACVYWFSIFRDKLIACPESSQTTQLQAMFTDSRGKSRSTYPQIGRKKVTLETCTQNTSNIYLHKSISKFTPHWA
jgi:hypothetical protein